MSNKFKVGDKCKVFVKNIKHDWSDSKVEDGEIVTLVSNTYADTSDSYWRVKEHKEDCSGYVLESNLQLVEEKPKKNDDKPCKLDLDYNEGDIVRCVGIDISCQKDREDFASGKQRNPLVVGGIYQVAKLEKKDWGNFATVISIDGKGVTVSGTYAHQFAKESIKINKQTKNNIMSKITTFAKNLVLSADEKLLRKHGLHDENGNNTSEAEDAIEEKMFNSPENQAYILEIAKGLEAESKK